MSTQSQTNESALRNVRQLGFQWETRDPFLFCVHHEDFYPRGNDVMGPQGGLEGRNIGQDFTIKDGWRMYHGSKVPGFPGHPHRGFETITVVRKGLVDHTDSRGAAGRYGDGDVQWMTAGKGLQHAEMFPLLKKDQDNPMELFQIWLNLPARDKFVEPHFKMLWSEAIPTYRHKDTAGNETLVEVIAGKLEGHEPPAPPPNSWAHAAENHVAIWNIQMEPGAQWQLPPAPAGVNRSLYFFKGKNIQIASAELPAGHSVDVESDQELAIVNGDEKAFMLILQGKPIAEPVVQHGPFVMNTVQEIQQAFTDYQRTGFGGWPWPVHDPVHERDQGRFAKHADGTLEEKS